MKEHIFFLFRLYHCMTFSDGPTSRFDDSPFLAYTPLTRYAEADDDFVNALQKYLSLSLVPFFFFAALPYY